MHFSIRICISLFVGAAVFLILYHISFSSITPFTGTVIDTSDSVENLENKVLERFPSSSYGSPPFRFVDQSSIYAWGENTELFCDADKLYISRIHPDTGTWEIHYSPISQSAYDCYGQLRVSYRYDFFLPFCIIALIISIASFFLLS